ncbi:MAG: hypothetical protein JAZ17_27990 [Candidatus Thiodiazotropha endolucinida]|nr:hypothetical protein [Candidatus Thiodiazotropha taylori]MCG8097412.1 hypothetical protein [Candidatus Thiodiazotropha endolucinida]MCG8103960.1 hypothetical protein [Candidatus Thiodiazotropha taylori]MCG8119943.1 hypothetical protein [Candidatus Thiodiazotropha taylori]MCW4265469.1 hypothetical protein [Candidatus Thiodiazotropha endolucinida]
MTKEIELEIINLFVNKAKRKRLIGFIESGKRSKVIDAINDPGIFDERFIAEFSGGERTAENLVKQYKKLGMGGRVYVMSENPDWGEQKFQMSYILDECLAACYDTHGYCCKTHTAFYEWHHSESSYFMSRRVHV